MDVVLLSRLQFAVSTMFHFLFVPFTLGLSFLVAYMETKLSPELLLNFNLGQTGHAIPLMWVISSVLYWPLKLP